MHNDDAPLACEVPIGQLVQELAPETEKVPAEQLEHVDDTAVPVLSEKAPATQDTQLDDIEII